MPDFIRGAHLSPGGLPIIAQALLSLSATEPLQAAEMASLRDAMGRAARPFPPQL